ncbi:MAG: hypothetical protein ACYCZB_13070 [Acidiphilium sp.]
MGIDAARAKTLCPAMDGKPPHRTSEAEAAAEARRKREAAALRENLARRKAQSRERAGAAKPETDRCR